MRDADTFTVDDPRFSTAQVVGPSMLSLDGADHARHRAPFAAPFRPTAVRERFADPAADEANRLIDGFAAVGQAECAAPLRARWPPRSWPGHSAWTKPRCRTCLAGTTASSWR